MTNEEIGKRIKEVREAKDISREFLAGNAEISTKFLYEIENGKKGMSATTLLKIANSLSCSCDYLLKGTDSTNYITREFLQLINKFDEIQIKKFNKIIKLLYEIITT